MNWFSHGVNKTKRLTKVLLGRDLLQGAQIARPTERHGSVYGGWVVCPQALDQNSIVYSFGVGTDAEGMTERFARGIEQALKTS